MATLAQIFQLSQDTTTLQGRIIAAMRRKANFVMNENPPVVTRVALAKDVLRDVYLHEQEFRVQIADNGTAQNEAWAGATINTDAIVDNDIIYIIDTTWDLVASLHFTAPPPP